MQNQTISVHGDSGGTLSKSVIICGMVRDCDRELSRNILSLEQIANSFADYRIVVFENNSQDHTKQVLRNWSNANSKVIVSINDFDESFYKSIPSQKEYLPFFSLARIKKYVDYRNKLLDAVDATGFDSDYLMLVDMDVARIDVQGVLSSFASDVEWDAVTANGYSRSISLRRRYHDSYALCEYGMQGVPQDADTLYASRKKFGSLRKNMPFQRVFSAYGGLAIFKREALANIRYRIIENNYGGVQVRCEHFSVFQQMAQNGFDKVYINPNMEVLYQTISYKSLMRFFENRVLLLKRRL